jgi:hypothetical protein
MDNQSRRKVMTRSNGTNGNNDISDEIDQVRYFFVMIRLRLSWTKLRRFIFMVHHHRPAPEGLCLPVSLIATALVALVQAYVQFILYKMHVACWQPEHAQAGVIRFPALSRLSLSLLDTQLPFAFVLPRGQLYRSNDVGMSRRLSLIYFRVMLRTCWYD